MVDEITDDLKDAQDITKAISNLMSEDLGTAASTVGSKVREIQEALKEAQEEGTNLSIEEGTFKNLSKTLKESQGSLKNNISFAQSFASELENITDQEEIKTAIGDKFKTVQSEQEDLQEKIKDKTKLTGDEVKEIEIKIAELSKIENFVKGLNAAVDKTKDIETATAEVSKQTKTFTTEQMKIQTSIGKQLDTIKKLDEGVAKVNSTASELTGQFAKFDSPPPLEFDTSAIDNAATKFRQIQDNIRAGDMAANIEITGDNQMEKIIGDLTAAQAAANLLSNRSELFAESLSKATDKSSALQAVTVARKIAEADIAKIQEQIPDRANEIALLETSLKIEETKLKLLPEGTAEYNIQKEQFEQIESTYIRQSNGLKGQQAEIKQLTSFKDDYLKKQANDIKNSKDIEATLQSSLSETLMLASASAEYSDNLGQAVDEAKKYGNNFRELAEQLGPTFDSAIEGIKSAKESVLGLAGSIPIFGGMIKKNLQGPFDDATKVITDGIGESLSIMQSKLDDTGSVTEAMTAGFGHMGQAIKDAGAMLKAAFSGPMLLIGSILLLIGMAVKRFFDLEAKSLEFRRELGLAADSTKDIESAAADVNREMAGFGVTLDHAYEAANALTKELGSTMLVTKEQIKMVSMMNAGLGISADNAVGVYETFKNLSGGSSEIAKNLSLTTVALSTAAGVPLDQVMGDIANASETVYSMSRGTGVELAVAAIEARRLGTNIESISSAMEQQLDFESSISAEMKMASMLGRHINMNAMREAAFAGDQVRYMEEQQKVMADIGDLSEMNMYQRKSIAAAMGMEVG